MVNLRAFLAKTRISVRDLMELEEGDIIQTEKPANSEIAVEVEGRAKFAGRMGQFRDNRAVRITRPVGSDERF